MSIVNFGIFDSCDCNQVNLFNITDSFGFNQTLSNPILDKNCNNGSIICSYTINRIHQNENYVIKMTLETNLSFVKTNTNEEVIAVNPCTKTDIIGNYQLDGTNSVYSYSNEASFCVKYIASPIEEDTYWNLNFQVVPKLNRTNFNLYNHFGVYLNISETDHIYTSSLPTSIYSIPCGLIFSYDSDDLTNIVRYADFHTCPSFPCTFVINLISPNTSSETILKPNNFERNIQTMVLFRNPSFQVNCQAEDPTINIDSEDNFLSEINHKVRTQDTFDLGPSGLNEPLCYYNVWIPFNPNQGNMSQIYYFYVERLDIISQNESLRVDVWTHKMGELDPSYKMFEFDQNSARFYKNFIIFGGLLSYDIPIWSTMNIVGKIGQGPNFDIVLDSDDQNNGILMSPNFPDISNFQSVNYSISCSNMRKFLLDIRLIDLTSLNSSLHLWIENNSTESIFFTNKTFKNDTITFYGSKLYMTYKNSHNSTGVVVHYQAIHMIEKKKPLWIIGLVLGALILVVIIAMLSYKYYKWRKNRIEIDKLQRMATIRNAETTISSSRSEPKDPMTIDESQLQVFTYEDPIGVGYSASVYKGHLVGPSPLAKGLKTQDSRFQDCKVAVKIANVRGRNEDLLLRQELEILKEIGYSEHIIAMLGWFNFEGNPAMVFELANGDLLERVKELKEEDKCLPMNLSLSFLWQIARGMAFIASRHFIHRDLAARNILLVRNIIAKISDFGLCCKTDERNTYQAGVHKQLPMKWLSIEALEDQIFSEKSDMWSFGVLLYEVFSRGKVPYKSMDVHTMKEFLLEGKRLECPEDATEEIYELMLKCWEKNPEARPNFEELTSILYDMLEENGVYGYLTPLDPENEELDNVAL